MTAVLREITRKMVLLTITPQCNLFYSLSSRHALSTKSQKEITGEIQAIIRQITASVTFLPLLSEPCSFDLLVYTDQDVTVPVAWEDSDPCYITNSEEVKLRSFNTQIHRVDLRVAFKVDEDGI